MKTDSEARSEWYPSPQLGWTLDGVDDGGLIGMSALAGPRRRSQVEKQPRRTVRVARRYAASPARVFDAWLDPAVARQWLFATASHPLAYIEIDARVKGSFCFVDRQDAVDGTRYTGEYLEITPPQRLVFTLSVAKFVETLPCRTRTVIAVSGGRSRLHPIKPPLFLIASVNSRYSSKCLSASASGICSIIFSAQIRHRNFMISP